MDSNNLIPETKVLDVQNSLEPYDDTPILTIVACHTHGQNEDETGQIYEKFMLLVENLCVNQQIKLVNFHNKPSN